MAEAEKKVAQFRKRLKKFFAYFLCIAGIYGGYYFYKTHEHLFDSMKEKKYNLRYVNEDIVVMEIITGTETSTVVYYAKKENKNDDTSQ